MKLVSWNILHIMHEMNYVGNESLVITAYPNENERKAKILEYIQSEYDNHNAVIINLQEVPGDYLDALLQKYGESVYYYTYDRIPSFKKPDLKKVYDNPTESLVSIVKNMKVVSSRFELYDTGKAGLILNLENNVMIYNVHMPFQWKNTVQLPNGKNIYITGDFNCNEHEAVKMFPDCVSFKNSEETFITRRNATITTNKYDHILCNFISPSENVLVVDKINLSDHYPVSSEITM